LKVTHYFEMCIERRDLQTLYPERWEAKYDAYVEVFYPKIMISA